MVDPPVATADAIPFSLLSLVMRSHAFSPDSTNSTASPPQARATSCFLGSVAGTEPLPIGETPMASNTVAMVLAVNWPPHAPAPGHAPRSRASNSSSVIRPAAAAPMPSKTS